VEEVNYKKERKNKYLNFKNKITEEDDLNGGKRREKKLIRDKER